MQTSIINFDPLSEYIVCNHVSQTVTKEGRYADNYNTDDTRFYVVKSNVSEIQSGSIVYLKSTIRRTLNESVRLEEGVYYIVHKSDVLGIISDNITKEDIEKAGWQRIKVNSSTVKGIPFEHKQYDDILLLLMNDNIIEIRRKSNNKILYRNVCYNIQHLKYTLILHNTIE